VDQQATILWIVHRCHRHFYHRKKLVEMLRRICSLLAQNSDIPTYSYTVGTLIGNPTQIIYVYNSEKIVKIVQYLPSHLDWRISTYYYGFGIISVMDHLLWWTDSDRPKLQTSSLQSFFVISDVTVSLFAYVQLVILLINAAPCNLCRL